MTKEQNERLTKAFRDRYDVFEKMFADGAVRELVDDFYTDDAIVEGHGMPKQKGKEAISKAFLAAKEAGLSTISIRMDEAIASDGDLAYQFITNDNNFAGRVEVHRALVVWRNTPQGWKCEVDFFCPKS